MKFKTKDKPIRMTQKIKKPFSSANSMEDKTKTLASEGLDFPSSSEEVIKSKGLSQEEETIQSQYREEEAKNPEKAQDQEELQPSEEFSKAGFEEAEKELVLLRENLQIQEEEAKKANEELLFLRAEFENYKRRTLEDRGQLIKYSGEKFISELATQVLDDLERALFASQSQQSVKDLQKGLQMVDKNLKKLFEKFGVSVLDPKGKDFDPSYQEALSYAEKEGVPEDQVLETHRKAYKLHDKVIRYAQVLVSKKTKDSV